MEDNKGTLLFVHGMCHGAWCWEPYFLPYFEQLGYHCMAINLRGHEQPGSTRPINHLGIEDYVADIQKAVSLLDEPPIIISHSMGGRVVQEYLKVGVCKKAVLMASVPPQSVLSTTFRIISKNIGIIRFLLKRDLLSAFKHFDQLMFGSNISPKNVANYKSKMCSESFRVYLQLLKPISRMPNERKIPMLVVGGTNDNIFTTKEIQNTASFYNADIILIEGAGHDLMLEPEYEKTAEIILEWIGR